MTEAKCRDVHSSEFHFISIGSIFLEGTRKLFIALVMEITFQNITMWPLRRFLRRKMDERKEKNEKRNDKWCASSNTTNLVTVFPVCSDNFLSLSSLSSSFLFDGRRKLCLRTFDVLIIYGADRISSNWSVTRRIFMISATSFVSTRIFLSSIVSSPN